MSCKHTSRGIGLLILLVSGSACDGAHKAAPSAQVPPPVATQQSTGSAGGATTAAPSTVQATPACGSKNNEGVALMLAGEKGANKAAAFARFEAACSEGCAEACVNVAMARLGGDGTEKQPEVGMTSLEAACRKNSVLACFAAGATYDLGMLVPYDVSKAEQFYRRSCNFDDDAPLLGSCHNLARMLERGAQQGDSGLEASELYANACARGFGSSCNNAGITAEKTGRSKAARKLYVMACDAGSQSGCKNKEYHDEGIGTRLIESGGAPNYFKSPE